jgi:hypothetical protein
MIFGDEGDEASEQELMQVRAELRLAEKRVESLENELDQAKATPTPAPSPTPVALPAESADWDPCAELGLCEFVASFDDALANRDVDKVLEAVSWNNVDCAAVQPNDFFGVQPIKCQAWPFAERIPTIAVGRVYSEGSLISLWRLHSTFEQFLGAAETDCGGKPTKVEKRVRAIMLPTEDTLPWQGDATVLIGAPLDCIAIREGAPGAQTRYAVGLSQIENGDWQIKALLSTSIAHISDSNYTSEFRYYPMN